MGAPKIMCDKEIMERLEKIKFYEAVYRFKELKKEVKSLKISNAGLQRTIYKNNW